MPAISPWVPQLETGCLPSKTRMLFSHHYQSSHRFHSGTGIIAVLEITDFSQPTTSDLCSWACLCARLRRGGCVCVRVCVREREKESQVCVYIYIYIYMCVCVCLCVCVYSSVCVCVLVSLSLSISISCSLSLCFDAQLKGLNLTLDSMLWKASIAMSFCLEKLHFRFGRGFASLIKEVMPH